MTFDELVTEVYSITSRPDQVAMTKSGIKAATLKAHNSDFYSKDIYETGVQFDNSQYKQSLDVITLIPNYKSFKYARRTDVQNGDATGPFFKMLTPEETVDSYGVNRVNIVYVAGRILEFRSDVDFQYMLFGCYVHPNVAEGSYASWVAEQHPYAIIHEAARRVYVAIGQMEEAAGQLALAGEEYEEIKISATTDTGS